VLDETGCQEIKRLHMNSARMSFTSRSRKEKRPQDGVLLSRNPAAKESQLFSGSPEM
jgi:hypothetical protein